MPSTVPSAILGQGTDLAQAQCFVQILPNFGPLVGNEKGMYMAGASSSLLADLLLVPSHIRP